MQTFSPEAALPDGDVYSALDESLLMWKGWLEICQLIPNKAAITRGGGTYEIFEFHTGYLWRFEIHAHKKAQPQQFLPVPVQFCLARRLKSLGFDCVGTLRTDRKFVPQALNSLTKRNMRQGQITGLTSGDVDVMVWRDTNRVAMIPTYHGNGQQTTRESTKPILILDYNIMMCRVDKKD
ncbi:hypothetical protein HW555_006479 [Spodoptera exigua]|uniref:PiggyBac transposable element-derived protein domain-containing protein n=1 Tax=Spodoptera exigua TaxID=7107 RepID=A0A835GJ11_SPOEX|nr:hypothetical protein HW555_006479 [Spodoptera exigua]